MSRTVAWPGRFLTVVRAMRLADRAAARTRWPRERIEAHQRRLLARLVAHATARSPFYRTRCGGGAGTVGLAALPPVRKDEWMQAFDDVVTDPRLRLDDVEAHLARVQGDALYLGDYRVMASSGTTGRRGLYLWSRREWLQALGIGMCSARLQGMRPRLPRVRAAFIGAPDAKHMTYRVGASVDVGLFRTLRLAATEPLPALVMALQAFQPHTIMAYPSILALLAAEQAAGRLRIAPQALTATGELLTEDMRRSIQAAWGVEPFSLYALSEIGPAAWSCPAGGGLHVREDSCILEAVDERGRPVPAGETGARLLVTSLLNLTQPVIRLEVSDQLTFTAEPCPCGSALRRIVRLHGRADDILDLPAAAGGRLRLHPIHLRGPLAARREVIAYQIVQRPRAIDIAVVLAAPDQGLCAGLTGQIGAVLRQHGAGAIDLRVRAVDAIAREPGVGKFKLVKVMMQDDAPAQPAPAA